MAEGKKKVIIYTDWIDQFAPLSNEEAGKLIKHLFAYVNDQNPEPIDRLTGLLFEPIKAQLKRDLKKWEYLRDKNKLNGTKGGRPKSNPDEPKITQNNPMGFSETQITQTNPDEPVKVITVITDNVITDKEILLKKVPKEKKNKKKKIVDYSIPFEQRREAFRESLREYELEYGNQMIENFYLYWAEKTSNDNQMRFEMIIEAKKTWELKMRIARWKKNNFDNGKQSKQSTDDAIRSFITQG